jgi:zinc and cadmium transporter
MIDLFLLSGVISIVSILPIVFINQHLGSFLNKNIHYLISFSAGVFLMTSGFIIIEVFEVFNSVIETFFLVIIGFIVAKTLVFIFPETHHHHDKCCSGHQKTTRKIIIGDSIHNIADGLLLASSFLISPSLLFPLFLSISIHEILQEISKFFVFKEAGYSTKKALIINFLTSLTIFIGVAMGLFLGNNENLQAIILAISSGFLLNIVFDDLLPHQHKDNAKVFFKHLIILCLGLLLMLVISYLFAHQH